jgi:hypothetical protein
VRSGQEKRHSVFQIPVSKLLRDNENVRFFF